MIIAKSMMQKCQNINLTEGGINFDEKSFTELFYDVLGDMRKVERRGSIQGLVIGVGFCLAGGVLYSKIKKK